MAKSNGAEDDTLTYWLTATVITRPTAWYIALYTSPPGDDNSGNEVDDLVDDTAYVRKTITFGAVASGSITNDLAAIFNACIYGSGGVPYTVTHVAIFDDPTAGNMIYHTSLDTDKLISVDDQANFAIGDLTITET